MSRTRTAKKAAAKTTRTPLERRPVRPEFISENQIRAAFAAALVGVTYTRITGWQRHDDKTVSYDLPTGALLTYDPAAKTPLTAWTPCPQEVRHAHPIATRQDLLDAQMQAARCTELHGHLAADQAAAATTPPAVNIPPSGTDTIPVPVLTPIPVPEPAKTLKALADQLAKSSTSNADTQATDVTALRNTDADTAKEHPDHD